jgi:hypothetical protein
VVNGVRGVGIGVVFGNFRHNGASCCAARRPGGARTLPLRRHGRVLSSHTSPDTRRSGAARRASNRLQVGHEASVAPGPVPPTPCRARPRRAWPRATDAMPSSPTSCLAGGRNRPSGDAGAHTGEHGPGSIWQVLLPPISRLIGEGAITPGNTLRRPAGNAFLRTTTRRVARSEPI